MEKTRWISRLFVLAACYDGLLGLLFLVAAGRVFDWFGVTPPNHFAYVQFPAALLIVFALMFVAIAREPVRNRNLIPYGILLKVSYCSIAFFHWSLGGIPGMWKPFAVFDLIFMILFGWAYMTLGDFREREENTD
jgi:hypothetical protein